MVDGECLRAVNITRHFRGVRALEHVSLALEREQITGLIGPNGSGKTTLLNLLSGLLRPNSGGVYLGQHEISAWSPMRRHRMGIARTFQNIRLFSGLTALENVEAALLGRKLHNRKKVATDMLEYFGVAAFRHLSPAVLSYGDQRRVELARALAPRPRFLLLDEPAAGMDSVETSDLGERLRCIPANFGCSVLLVEHDLPLVMSICHAVLVLNTGEVIFSGAPVEAMESEAVRAAYFGRSNWLDASQRAT